MNWTEAIVLLQQGKRVKRPLGALGAGWFQSAVIALRYPAPDPDHPVPHIDALAPDLIQILRGHEGDLSDHLWGPNNEDRTAVDWEEETDPDAPAPAENKPIPPLRPVWG